MKAKLVVFLLLSFLLNGCLHGYNIKRMNRLTEKTYIGMPESDFKKVFKIRIVEHMENNYTVYRVRAQDDFGSRDDRFFYFSNGKLSGTDKGVRALDYRMKIE